MTFYLKYRSQTLDELDLTDVRESLTKIVKSGNIPHAFLFSGPRGAGKTSAARILAKIINCTGKKKGQIGPCNKCDDCLTISKSSNIDVIEIDAASHRGIDDVRVLRDAVKLSPAKALKKIYIIDEAHMLTTEASNALLKTLEEPPDHVIFILATTNPEKLLETIRSRTVNIKFKKATVTEVVRALTRALKGEKLKADEEALLAIAKMTDGSLREAHKILEQLITSGTELIADKVTEALTKKSAFDLEAMIGLLADKNANQALLEVEKSINSGVSATHILENLVMRLREALLAIMGLAGEGLENFTKADLIILIELLVKASEESKNAILEQIPLELAIIKWCETTGKTSRESSTSGTVTSSNNEDGSAKSIKSAKGGKEAENASYANSKSSTSAKNEGNLGQADLESAKDADKSVQPVTSGLLSGDLAGINDEIWGRILAEVRPLNTSTEALLRAAKPLGYDGTILTLGVFYSFHKERLEERQHRNLLEEIAGNILGAKVKIECMLTAPPERKIVEDKDTDKEVANSVPVVLSEGTDADIVKVAKEIFGS